MPAPDALPESDGTPRIVQLLEGPEGRARLEQLARRARGTMRSIKRVGLDHDDLVMSTIRTALRQEQETPCLADEVDDIWGWICELFWKKREQYQNRQHARRHTMAVATDVFPLDSKGVADRAEHRASDPATMPGNAEDVEAYIAKGLEVVRNTVQDPKLLQIASLMLQQYTQTEIAERLQLSRHQVVRKVREIRNLLSREGENV